VIKPIDENIDHNIAQRGSLFILSSPSGAGKTTLARRLLEEDDNISMSVSVTTRMPRPGEVDGQDYRFVDEATFKDFVKTDQLLEWAQVFDNHYGTPKVAVMDKIEAGQDVLFDIDWQGAQQLRQHTGQDMISIFVLPPSRDELERRLVSRGQDDAEIVAKRMAQAANEISHWAEYDYVIVNKDIETSVSQLKSIVTTARLQRERQTGLAEFVRHMIGG